MYGKKIGVKAATLFGCAFVLLSLGFVVIISRPNLYQYLIDKVFVLHPTSHLYDAWKINPVPLEMKFHMFNWTNPESITNSSIKPHFDELGPYSFKEIKEKVNLTWNDNGTVSFSYKKTWWFDPERSNGTLNDIITSIQPIATSSAWAAKDWNFLLKQSFNTMLSSFHSVVHSSETLAKVLFDGYQDSLLTIANTMPTFGLVELPDYERFGWFFGRNGSNTFEGQFNMDTGAQGQLGELYSWKHMSQTPYYRDHCGSVSGSAGEFYPMDITKETLIRLFSPDLCRYVELEFEKEVNIRGLHAYKFVADDRFLDNGTKIPENKCFCEGDCMPSGALNISACRFNSPAYVSLPHFHKGDPYYQDSVEGLKSDDDLHGFYMIFEPKTGMALEVAARLQLNILLQPIRGIRLFRNVPKVFIPVLWFQQKVEMPDLIIFLIKLLVHFDQIVLGIGVFLMCLAAIFVICGCRLGRRKNVNLSQNRILSKEEVPLTKKISLMS